jgi:hypothetical protein
MTGDGALTKAGDRFGVLLFVRPALSIGLWSATSGPILLVGRRSLALGLVLALAIRSRSRGSGWAARVR